MNKAKNLITGEGQPINEDPGDMSPGQGPGGPPRRPTSMRHPGMDPRRDPRMGGPGIEEPAGMLSRKERVAMKDLVLLDLLQATGNDPFFKALVDMAIKGTDPEPVMIRHFIDEAGKYAKEMTPEINELMNKLASSP